MRKITVSGWIWISLVVFGLALLYAYITSNFTAARQSTVNEQQYEMQHIPLDECLRKSEERFDNWYRTAQATFAGGDPEEISYASIKVREQLLVELNADKDECYRRYK